MLFINHLDKKQWWEFDNIIDKIGRIEEYGKISKRRRFNKNP